MLNAFFNYLFNHTPLLYLTQSLWRDEAFSVLIAQPGGLNSIKITAADFNPPLYYLILHYWMIIFGKSEIALRLLSFLFFIALVFVSYSFAKVLFKQKWPIFLTFLTLTCPILVYYGFEVRMYSLYALTTTASMYFFFIKKWKPYLVATTLALYTQPYTIFVPLTQFLYLFLTHQLKKNVLQKLLLPFVFYLPWLIVLIQQFKNSRQMWIYPIDLNLINAVLANLLIGYEGTPGFLWPYMKFFSLGLLILYLLAFLQKRIRQKYLLFFLWVFTPLIITLSFSFLKPIFVNRYLITVSVAQLFLITICLTHLPFKKLKKIIAVSLLVIFIFFLLYLPPFIKKVDLRSTFNEVNRSSQPNDVVFASSPLVFFESVYYSTNPEKVFLYNPDMIALPAYLGKVLIPTHKQAVSFPIYPNRAFMIYEDGHYELFSLKPTLNL